MNDIDRMAADARRHLTRHGEPKGAISIPSSNYGLSVTSNLLTLLKTRLPNVKITDEGIMSYVLFTVERPKD